MLYHITVCLAVGMTRSV